MKIWLKLLAKWKYDLNNLQNERYDLNYLQNEKREKNKKMKNMCKFAPVCTYPRACVCRHIYTYTYIHIHIYTHMSAQNIPTHPWLSPHIPDHPYLVYISR